MTTTVTIPVAIVRASFLARVGSGPISVPGLKVGDAILSASESNHERSPVAIVFESFISVDDEVQQLYSGDLSGDTYTLLLLRGV
jgi:hypothetical protein